MAKFNGKRPVIEEETTTEVFTEKTTTSFAEDIIEAAEEVVTETANLNIVETKGATNISSIYKKIDDLKNGSKHGELAILSYVLKDDAITRFLTQELGDIKSQWSIKGVKLNLVEAVNTLKSWQYPEKNIYTWLQSVTGFSIDQIDSLYSKNESVIVPVCVLKKKDFVKAMSDATNPLGGVKSNDVLDISKLIAAHDVLNTGIVVKPINLVDDSFYVYVNMVATFIKILRENGIDVPIGRAVDQFSISMNKIDDGYLVGIYCNKYKLK